MNYETFFITYIVFWWATCILYKDNLLPNYLCEQGERIATSKNELLVRIGILLQELSTCFFCMDNWIALFLFAAPMAVYFQDPKLLLLQILYSGISTHFRK